jgi:hypothetical protein
MGLALHRDGQHSIEKIKIRQHRKRKRKRVGIVHIMGSIKWEKNVRYNGPGNKEKKIDGEAELKSMFPLWPNL